MIPPIMDVAEELIAKGVDALTVVKIMGTLIPQGLGITIPMALLLGVLIGLGRLSSDRETVALQACGVSIYRILFPLLILGTFATVTTAYVLIFALPDANQAFREITFRTVASRAEGEVKERVFYDDFPNVMLYVREVSPTGSGWNDVFLADTRDSDNPDIYVAEKGQVVLDATARTVDIVLQSGSGHQVDPEEPNNYEIHEFDQIVIGLDPETVFPRAGPQRGYPELTIPQLQQEASRMSEMGMSPHRPIMEVHRKFSIPYACFVFVLIGLCLGVTNRKDGKLASFALGIGVIFAYYVIMYGAEALAKASMVSPHLAMWLPNILLGMVGLVLLSLRAQSIESTLRLPAFLVKQSSTPLAENPSSLPFFKNSIFTDPKRFGIGLLDWYVARLYIGISLLAFVGLLGIFYISTFIDLSDKLFKGQTSGTLLLQYFWYATPQFIYFVLPISALVATLVTVGLLTKSSELTVMKACGVSLYRASLPVFISSLLWSMALFGLSESVLANSNRQAQALNQEIRTGEPSRDTLNVLNRQWSIADDGSIYHYLSFDPDQNKLGNFSIYEFNPTSWRLSERIFLSEAKFNNNAWTARNLWRRDLESFDRREGDQYQRHSTSILDGVEGPDYFKTRTPDPELMNFSELQAHINDLGASGFDVVRLVVALHRKVSFPLVTLILTLIAIPFAVTTGPRGALYGIGVGIALAFTYWTTINIFAAIGTAGLLAPILAAWAPNLLFGASATYLLLTVRT
tara:strand:+ start:2087 stop:4321 length:2235 start_codon:yes stop_codon:yes gene_type:complete